MKQPVASSKITLKTFNCVYISDLKFLTGQYDWNASYITQAGV